MLKNADKERPGKASLIEIRRRAWGGGEMIDDRVRMAAADPRDPRRRMHEIVNEIRQRFPVIE